MGRVASTGAYLSGSAVTIGVFDGVHRGHQALLAETVRLARDNGYIPAALTFDPHPSAVFAPARTPLLLGTLSERIALLELHGAQSVVVAPFDRALAALTPDEFVREWLVDRSNARAVVVGDDFRFGCDRSGDTAFLRRAGEKYGFAVATVPPVFVAGVPCRSTTIRQMIAGGQVKSAQTLLGRPYSLTGTVVHGRKLGRTIGFPTANLDTPNGLLIPGAGVYVGVGCWMERVLGVEYRVLDVRNGASVPPNTQHPTPNTHLAAVSIGTNPTVTPGINAPRTVEAFLLDFDGDIYDQTLTVTFTKFLRGTEKFDSLDALVEQMHRDIARVRSGE